MNDHFNAKEVWEQLLRDKDEEKITVFMAVPTIYFNLINYYDENLVKSDGTGKYTADQIREKLSKIRLMVSGSTALPDAIMERWEEISGHKLLERYGMTEIGMGLSNLYQGPRHTVK